jgi:NAD(P)-dependent dehydrogenase (short-subunit alcohol dehydrogenase family)
MDKKKSIMITGAASGIGRETALESRSTDICLDRPALAYAIS